MVKKRIFAVICIAVVVCGCAFALSACKKPELYIDTSELSVQMFDEYYVAMDNYDGGNTFDLSKAFKDSDFALDESSEHAKLNNKILTTYSEGAIKLNVTANKKTTTKNVFIVKGVNVFNFNQLENVIETKKKNAIIHDTIVFPVISEDERASIHIKNNLTIYGNGNIINAEATSKSTPKKWGGDALIADSDNVKMQDFHILGLDTTNWTIEQKKNFDISNLERYGSLITYRTDSASHKVGGTIKNIIAENGHALVSATGATLHIEGSIFKNAADSLVSVETKDNGGTKLTVKNNVFINGVVSAITCWGYIKTDSYVQLTTEGFMDVYNWKNAANAKLMPSSETLSSLVNSLVSDELSKKKNQKYLYNLADSKYIHIAIIVLATGGLKQNNAKINGVAVAETATTESYKMPSTDNWVLKKLPGASMANTACVIGYGNNQESNGIKINPATAVNLNKIYNELRNGR